MRFALIRRPGFVSFSAVLIFLAPSATPTAASADSGIASRYPGDKSIGSDPDVILADDFESYTSVSQLTTNWTGAQHTENMSMATASDKVFAGAKAIQISLPVSSAEPGAGLIKKFPNAPLDALFVRIYEKWDANYNVSGSNHNGIHISGGTLPGPGIPAPADGTGFFIFLLQNNIQGRAGETDPGYDHVYAYWPKQRTNYGDHWFPDGWVVPGGQGNWLLDPALYPDFRAMPNHLPQRGKWYCYEFMVRVNTPGKNDGELKWWVDGKLTADLPDLNFRSIPSLKIDNASVILGANQTTQITTKWYDNIVMAKSYIGPMASASPTPTPTPTVSPSLTQGLKNISTRGTVQKATAYWSAASYYKEMRRKRC